MISIITNKFKNVILNITEEKVETVINLKKIRPIFKQLKHIEKLFSGKTK